MTGRAAGVLESSRTMALGTTASRATGFIRTVVIAAAIGDRAFGDAYNLANVLPNIIYELLLGGVLGSVVVPLLIAAERRGGRAEGEAYAQRLLTLVTLVLGAATVLAVGGAPYIMALFPAFASPRVHQLSVDFARFFLPQILFYGIGATIGAVLNARGRFAAPMWAPVLNNLIVIGTGLIFLAQHPADETGLALSTGEFLTLAIGTTLGIVVQTVALVPSLRATGFRLRAQFDFRVAELRTAARLAGWLFVYVAANQVSMLVVIALARAASDAAGPAYAVGYSAYLYAFTIFTLPHSIVAVSVITALLPDMSRAAIGGQRTELRAHLSSGLRVTATLIVPASWALLLLGPLIGVAIFGYGRIEEQDAELIGFVLAGFAVGGISFSAFQVQLRACYAEGDTRTPALINIAVNLVNIVADVILYAVLPSHLRIVGLAVGFAASYLAGNAFATWVVNRRLPPGRAEHVVRTYVRLSVAGALGAGLALAVALGLRAVTGPGPGGTALALLAGVLAGLAAYLWIGLRLRVPELRQVLALIPGLHRLG